MKYLKDFDDIVRKIIKTKYSCCYVCQKYVPEDERTVGHIISRRNIITRWDLNFIRMECGICNCHEDQNNIIFRENLIEEVGTEKWEQMKAYSRLIIADSVPVKISGDNLEIYGYKIDFQVKTAECLLAECQKLGLQTEINRLKKIIKELKGEK